MLGTWPRRCGPEEDIVVAFFWILIGAIALSGAGLSVASFIALHDQNPAPDQH